MWSACALIAALSLAPAQGGQLRLSNERFTHGILGPTRAEGKFLPGDHLFLCFDIDNLVVDDHGKARYNMALEVLKGNKPVLKQGEGPQDLEALNSLGGGRVPAFVHQAIGTDLEAGEYTIRVTVTDRTAKKSQTLVRAFQVLPKAYGIVRVQLAYPIPQSFLPAPAVAVPGQTLLVNCGVVGFERDRNKRQPLIQCECRILDESGKPVVPKPDLITIEQDVPEKFSVSEVPFVLQLNRPGKFTVELKATDRLSKKTSTASFPLTVLDVKP